MSERPAPANRWGDVFDQRFFFLPFPAREPGFLAATATVACFGLRARGAAARPFAELARDFESPRAGLPFVRAAAPPLAAFFAAPFFCRVRRRWSSSPIRPGISLGMRATGTPAASNAAIFSAAVPVPPEMIARACPMRFPG